MSFSVSTGERACSTAGPERGARGGDGGKTGRGKGIGLASARPSLQPRPSMAAAGTLTWGVVESEGGRRGSPTRSAAAVQRRHRPDHADVVLFLHAYTPVLAVRITVVPSSDGTFEHTSARFAGCIEGESCKHCKLSPPRWHSSRRERAPHPVSRAWKIPRRQPHPVLQSSQRKPSGQARPRAHCPCRSASPHAKAQRRWQRFVD